MSEQPLEDVGETVSDVVPDHTDEVVLDASQVEIDEDDIEEDA